MNHCISKPTVNTSSENVTPM